MTDNKLDIIKAPRGLDAYTNEIVDAVATYLDRPLLSIRERRKIIKRINATKKLLESGGYYDDLSEFAYVTRQIVVARRAGKHPEPAHERKRSELISKLAPLRNEYATLEYLNDRLEADIRERKRLAMVKKLKSGMGNEAVTVADNLSDALSRMNFKDEVYNPRNGKTRIKRVTFSDCDIRPDRIYYKIDNLRKMPFFGYRNVLPDGVKLSALLDDKVMLDLSLALQRPVTFEATRNNGAWLVYHRIRKEDEIPSLVDYRDVMAMYPTERRSKLMIPAGVREGKRLVWVSMADNPHALIAGTTGGGKSNMGHVILCTLIDRHTPDELRVLLVDLKGGIDLSQYESTPHLVGKIVRNVPQVYPLLQTLDKEMERRFKLLLDNHCKNIDIYNSRYDEKLPHVFMFIDEFQQVLTGENKNKTMELLGKILAQGRAPGVHLIITTQTPKTDVLPTMFQSNIGLKIVGRMETQAASMTALQNAEATRLPKVPGRMIVQIGEPITVQTPFIPDDEQSEIIERAKTKLHITTPPRPVIAPTPTPTPEPPKQTPSTTQTNTIKLTDSEKVALELIGRGKNRLTDIAMGMGVIKQRAHDVLGALRAKGLVIQSGKGQPYELASVGVNSDDISQ